MTASELAAAKAELATMKAARLKLACGDKRATVSSGGESVTFAQANVMLLDQLVRETEAKIDLAEGRGRRPIHYV